MRKIIFVLSTLSLLLAMLFVATPEASAQSERPSFCPPPGVIASGAFLPACLEPPVAEPPVPEPPSASSEFRLVRALICIEDGRVADLAPDGSVGTSFIGDSGVHYLIHAGGPTCQVNCHDGFDFNCDDRLGDFCDAGIDLNTVAGVHECIDALKPVEEPANGGVLLVAVPDPVAIVGLGLFGFGA